MTFKLVISCAGVFAADAAVTRANHRTAIAVDAEGGTSLVDAGMPHVDTLLQSLRGGLSDKKGAAQMVSLVEDLAKRAAAKGGAGPDLALVSNIKDFAQSILDHTTSNHQSDKDLLQEKLATIEGCPALHARLMNEAVGLRGEMEGDRGAHESCRGAEGKLFENRSSLCDEYDAYRGTIDSDINECTKTWFLEDNVAKDETVNEATVTQMESCLVAWTPWIEELHRLYLTCDAAAGAHDDKVGVCNEMQVDFEHGFCEYHHKLGDHCEQMSRCYDNAVEDQANAHTHVEARQEARKSDWTAGSRIACYASVFETVDPAEKQSVLSRCQTEVITTDHLNLAYPATPARPECTLTDSHPCDRDTWQTDEYFSKAWYAKAPTAECRPCSQNPVLRGVPTPHPTPHTTRQCLVHNGWRTDEEINVMSADDIRNTVIVELNKRDGLSIQCLQRRSNEELADKCSESVAVACKDLRQCLVHNGWRTDEKIHVMSADDVRNTVIVELNKRDGLSIQCLQGRSNEELADEAADMCSGESVAAACR